MKTPLKLLKSLLIGFVFYHIVYTASSNAQTDSSVTPFCYHINAGATYSFVGYSTYATFGLNWDGIMLFLKIKKVSHLLMWITKIPIIELTTQEVFLKIN